MWFAKSRLPPSRSRLLAAEKWGRAPSRRSFCIHLARHALDSRCRLARARGLRSLCGCRCRPRHSPRAAACAASGVSFPLSASLFSWVRNPSTANAAEPSRKSSNCTRCPATAAICAIPLPIAPAPITATVLVVGSGAALMPLDVVATLHDHEAVRHKRCISVRRIRCRVTTGAMEIREGGRLVNEYTTR